MSFDWDGVNGPQIVLEMAFGGATTVDPGAGYFILGTSVLDTGVLGGVGWVQIPIDDIKSISHHRGVASEIDPMSPGTMSVVLDNFSGNYDPQNLSGPYVSGGVTQVDVGAPARLMMVFGGVTFYRFYGFVEEVIPDHGPEPFVTINCADGLQLLGRNQLGAISPVNAGDTTSVRMGRLLDAVSWPTSKRSLAETGLSTCQSAIWGDWALTLAQQISDTELGNFFIDGAGVFTFWNRLHLYTATRSQTSQATFSDIGTDVDYSAVTISRDGKLLFNQAALTRTGGTVQTANDAVAQARYGVRTYPGLAGTLLQTDAAALSLASWLVGRFKRAIDRITQLSAELLPQGVWSSVLPLQLWDRVTVKRTYTNTGAAALSMDVWVQGIQEDLTTNPPGYKLTLDTRSVQAFKPFILDTSTLGSGCVA